MIFLREAKDSDLELIRAWRSSPLVYQGFVTQKEPLTYMEHHNWWNSRKQLNWREFIIVLQEDELLRDMGVVTIGQLEHWSPEIGYFIGNPADWNKGYGKQAVWCALDWLRRHGYKYTHTTVKTDNQRSIKLLESLGFEYLGKAREGEVWYQKSL